MDKSWSLGRVCLATNNAHKLHELKDIIGESMQLLSLSDIGCLEEIPEDQRTIEGNSLQKAQYIWENYKVNCIADDTGLLVESLNGEPGVFSARYAGPQRDSSDNIRLLLQKLDGLSNRRVGRRAHFKTVVTFIQNGRIFQFEGKVQGEILEGSRGTEGFGYDPVFQPEGKKLSFAEMNSQEKNAISHRGRAMQQLAAFLVFQQKKVSIQ